MRRLAKLTRYYGLRNASRVQAMSEDQVREAAEECGQRRRLVPIPNGVNTKAWPTVAAESKRSARRRLGLSEDGVLVLFAGRFTRIKGIEDLLDAWHGVDAPNETLLLVGSVNTMDPVGPLKMQRRVIVHDHATHIQNYYEAANVVVLPSRASEGMSNVLLEAMACRVASGRHTGRCGCLDDYGRGRWNLGTPERSPRA